MSTRGKGGRCVGLTTLPFSFPDFCEIWEPQSPGTLYVSNRPIQGWVYLAYIHYVLLKSFIGLNWLKNTVLTHLGY
jgi:hypothetical protein